MLKRFGVVLAAVMLLYVPQVSAYETDIRAAPDEVYQAALSAFKNYGIDKADASRYLIETDWIPGVSVRKRAFLGIGLAQKYQKKTKVYFHLSRSERFTHVVITSKCLFRSADAAPQASWKALKPSREDYDLEKECFRTVLSRMEEARQKNPSATPSSV